MDRCKRKIFKRIYIYTIDSEKKVRTVDQNWVPEKVTYKYVDGWARRERADLEFDIMENIPSMQIGSNASAFGDYNVAWDEGSREYISLADSENEDIDYSIELFGNFSLRTTSNKKAFL